MDIDAIAEAIRAADPFALHHNQQRNRYLDDYRRMAKAAVDSLGLTQFWSVAYADGYHAEQCWENWDEARDHAAEDPDDSKVVTSWATGWHDAPEPVANPT